MIIRIAAAVFLLLGSAIASHALAAPQSPEPDAGLQAGFRAMYALDFAESERRFQAYTRLHPEDPLGPAALAARLLFVELDRLHALDAEFYVDDKNLLAETEGKPDVESKKRLLELTAQSRKLAEEIVDRDAKNENALFALAFVNGLEADYGFLVEKARRAAAKPGGAGYNYAKKLIDTNPAFYDAYIWTGVTNYVVASLPWPIRWLAKLRGYPGNKETAITDLRSAAGKGGLLKPYARILLAVTFLRENRKAEARDLLQDLAEEFPANPLFSKHAKRLEESLKKKK